MKLSIKVIAVLLGTGIGGVMYSAQAQTPLFEYTFNETGTTTANAGSAANGTLICCNASNTITDLHTADTGGNTGEIGDRGFDNTAATGMGSLGVGGNVHSTALASAAIGGLRSFSIQGWFKASEVIRNGARLVDMNNTGSGFYLSGATTPGALSLGINGTYYATSTAAYGAVNTWVFFRVTYDSTLATDNVSFYVGGVGTPESLVNTCTIANAPVVIDPQVGLAIGNTRGYSRPFHGVLDDIRIYGSKTDGAGIPLFNYRFPETGTVVMNTGSVPDANLTLYNASNIVSDMHTADAEGTSGFSGDRAVNCSGAIGMGTGFVGPYAKTTANASSALDGLQSFTIKGWFKASEVLKNGARLVDMNNTGSGFYLSGGATPGTLTLGINGTYYATSLASYSAVNTWVFFAVVYDATLSTNNVSFYVGGLDSNVVRSAGTYTLSQSPILVDPHVGIAIGNIRSPNRPFHGTLDNIVIFGSCMDNAGARTLFQLESLRLADVGAPPAATFATASPAAQNLATDNGRSSANTTTQWCNILPQSSSSNKMVGSSFTAPYDFLLDQITVDLNAAGSAAAGSSVSISILDMGTAVPSTGGTVTGARVLQTDSGIALPAVLPGSGYLSFDISHIRLVAGKNYGFLLKFDSALANRNLNVYLSNTPGNGGYGFGFQSSDNGATLVSMGEPLHFYLSSAQTLPSQIAGTMVTRAVNGPVGAWFMYPHSNGFWRTSTSWDPATFIVARTLPGNVRQLVEFDPATGDQQVVASIPNGSSFYSIATNGLGVCSTGNQLTLFDLTGAEANRTLSSVSGTDAFVDLSDIAADGTSVVTCFAYPSTPSYQLVKVNVATGTVQSLLTTSWRANHAHFSPYDNSWVSFSHEILAPASDRLWAWNAMAAPSGTYFPVTTPSGPLAVFAHERSMFHKAGVVAVGMGASNGAGLYEVNYDGTARRIVSGEFNHCNISRDGRWMVADTTDYLNQSITIVAVNFQTGATQILYNGTMDNHPWHGHPHISPDGKWVIFNDYSLQRTVALEIDQAELDTFLQ